MHHYGSDLGGIRADHPSANDCTEKDLCVLQENQAPTLVETSRVPVMNVPTGDLPVAVEDHGTVLLPLSVVDDGRSFAEQSRRGHQPGMRLPTDLNARTNENLANIQPANSGNVVFTGLFVQQHMIVITRAIIQSRKS